VFLDLLTIPACQTDFPIRRFIHVNDAVCRLLGYSREEVMARPPFDFIDRGSAEHMAARTRAVLAGLALENNVEVRIMTRSGRSVSLQIFPKLLFRYGLPCGALAVGQDNTRRNLAEQKLRDAEVLLRRDNQELARLVEEKTREALAIKRLADIGMLAATVAHELRNPLAVIKMAAYNLKKRVAGAELASHLSNIDRKVNESEQIIYNLLFYSRLQQPSFASVILHEIVEEALAQMEFSRPGVRTVRDFSTLKDRPVESDPVQVTEVVKNILCNAFDAVKDQADGLVRLAARVDRGTNRLELEVSDNGVGIAPEDLTRIMDPFFSTKKGGTGLGLAVAGRIIELHHGQIAFSSQPGRGTKVTIKLPLRQATS
jgi:PAS domain S-box-containing protein